MTIIHALNGGIGHATSSAVRVGCLYYMYVMLWYNAQRNPSLKYIHTVLPAFGRDLRLKTGGLHLPPYRDARDPPLSQYGSDYCCFTSFNFFSNVWAR